MLEILQRVVEESAPTLVTARLEAEERRNAIRLREEQDAAYRAALEADQVTFLTKVLVSLLGGFRSNCQWFCIQLIHLHSTMIFLEITLWPLFT